MAGMFYSSKEAADKLGKTEDELAEMVKEGKLREFRDGPNLLFKVDEIESLVSDTSITAELQSPAEAQEPDLAEEPTTMAEEPAIEEEPTTMAEEPAMEEEETPPMMEVAEEESEEPAEDTSEDVKLSGADTTAVASEGINILGETDTEYNLTDDTLAETRAASGATSFIDSALDKTGADEASLEEIEDDVNLDTFGSGSGLLDLSLQADDTSLGGILDEIYTPEGDEETKEGSAMEIAAEADLMTEEEGAEVEEEAELIPVATAATAVYVEPAADAASNIFGFMLFLPLLIVMYTLIVALAGANNMVPSIMAGLQGIIWYVLVVAGVACVVMAGAASAMGAGGGTKAVKKPKKKKAPKPKKEKKPKEKKPKKEKKKKEKKPKKEKKKKKKEK